MAFNPFAGVRKYSKVIFVVLGVVCMFTFVLSSGVGGQGDFVGAVTSYFGSGPRNSKEEFIGKIGGKNIYVADLGEIARQRRIANLFVYSLLARSHDAFLRTLTDDEVKTFDSQTQSAVATGKQQHSMAMFILNNLQFYRNNAGRVINDIMQFRLTLTMINSARVRLQNEPSPPTKVLAILDTLYNVVEADLKMVERAVVPVPGSALYFGGGFSGEELVDFLVWQQQADRLGIVMGDEEISKELNRLTMGQHRAVIGEVLKALTTERVGVNPTFIRNAIAAEFRAKAAQVATLGISNQEFIDAQTEVAVSRASIGNFGVASMVDSTARMPTGRAVPTALSPFDAWKFYKENRTSVNVTLLEIPVKSALPRVTGEPTAEEIRELYEKGKKIEASPASDIPGFMQPRKAKIQYISYKEDAPAYRAAAAAARLLEPLAGLEQPGWFDARLSREMAILQLQLGTPLWSDLFGFSFTAQENSTTHPEALAALIAQSAGAAMTGVHPVIPIGGHIVTAIQRETRVRAHLGSAAVMYLAGMDGHSPEAFVAGLVALSTQAEPKPVPSEALSRLARENLEVKMLNENKSAIARADVEAFRSEVLKRGKKADKTDVQKYIADTIAARGWTTGVSTELRDFYSLPSDPGLKGLYDLFATTTQNAHAGLTPPVVLPERITIQLMYPPGMNETNAGQQLPGLFDPRSLNFVPDTYAWKIEETLPKVQSEEAAKPMIRDYWRKQKAADLAKEEAETLLNEAKAQQLADDIKKVKDFLATKKQFNSFDLGPMARLNPNLQARAGIREYEEYRVPADKVRYPSQRFVIDLLALADKLPADAFAIVHDQPRDHYYLAIRTKVEVPPVEDFRVPFSAVAPGSGGSDKMLADRFMYESARYRSDVMQALRTAAGVDILILARANEKIKPGDE